jgi:uncharacterized cupredoxin-like copper-binding protein
MSPTAGPRLWRLLVAGGVALLSLATGGCASSKRSAQAPAVKAAVTERDFHISAPATLKAGRYSFAVHNEGSTDHELILVRAQPGGLPLRPDGLTVDEESLEADEPGSLAPGNPGAVRPLTVDLAPGRYVFFCNMEGHFMAGMHAEVVVS